MVTRTSEPIDSIKTLLILAERGYGDDSRGIVVRKPARQVCGVNGEFQTPFRTVRGDVSQKFLGIANQEVSISRSVPHGEVHKCEALFVVGEQVFRYFLKMLHLVSPADSAALRDFFPVACLVVINYADARVGNCCGVFAAYGWDIGVFHDPLVRRVNIWICLKVSKSNSTDPVLCFGLAETFEQQLVDETATRKRH
jgi:hypothetical protein